MNDNDENRLPDEIATEIRQLRFHISSMEQMAEFDLSDVPEEERSRYGGAIATRVELASLRAKMDCLIADRPLRLFVVTNTSSTKQFVVAKSEACARIFSQESGHIRSERNGVVRVIGLGSITDPSAARSLKEAIQRNAPGCLRKIGDRYVRSRLGV